MTTMLASDLPLPRIGRGKVRDIYAVGDDRVLLLTTDRISAFDVVMAETIPMKGAVLSRRTTVFPIECVIRGYLSGSAWKEYAQQGTLAGEKLAPGLLESAKLEPSIFSPATKAETGHDEKLSRDQGIIIADTKFEFGRDGDGRIILIDEVMTPDSSRFWAADAYRAGPPPPLPASVVDATSKRYLEAYRRITGAELEIGGAG